MIVTAHIIAGGVTGELLDNSLFAFLAGFVLHFVLDAIPHFDNLDHHQWTKRQIIFTVSDFVLSFALVFFVIKLPFNLSLINNPFAWGALGGFLPDLLDNFPLWSRQFRATKFGEKFHKFNEWIHHAQPGPVIGLTTQLAVIIIFLVIHFVVK